MTMDLGQLTQLTNWLDEERRRDKAELIRLQQQVQRQETELQDQSHLLRTFEERLPMPKPSCSGLCSSKRPWNS